ncbi:hypothetical protein HU200_057317 [Digitaria exilis]|uniref:Glutaredoxin domain-containing protein n=1 Tax=Digitaria exilis TaxID=1010633 RepID=A0A835AFB1_9POAL|nr:hypothetical protein HU200_057317 [Digitaria exilis]
MAERVSKLSAEKAVVIFTRSQCPMCHTVSSLFSELGVSAAVHELDKDPRGREMERELTRRLGHAPPVPAVFIGGKRIELCPCTLPAVLFLCSKAPVPYGFEAIHSGLWATATIIIPQPQILLGLYINFQLGRTCKLIKLQGASNENI